MATAGMSLLAKAELSELETKYLKDFTDDSRGNAGPGFNPRDTFDEKFHQAVLKSKDEDLQRAFILQQLPSRIASILRELIENRKMTGINVYEPLNEEDRVKLATAFEECMQLLQKLDANQHKYFYKEYRDDFEAANKPKP